MMKRHQRDRDFRLGEASIAAGHFNGPHLAQPKFFLPHSRTSRSIDLRAGDSSGIDGHHRQVTRCCGLAVWLLESGRQPVR